jgi:hypothetical protein
MLTVSTSTASHPKWPRVITTLDHVVAHNLQAEIQKGKLKVVTLRCAVYSTQSTELFNYKL